MAKRRVGVEYSPSMLEPVSPGAVSPDRALCLPTFSHFVIVNKTFLSLSLALRSAQRGKGAAEQPGCHALPRCTRSRSSARCAPSTAVGPVLKVFEEHLPKTAPSVHEHVGGQHLVAPCPTASPVP